MRTPIRVTVVFTALTGVGCLDVAPPPPPAPSETNASDPPGTPATNRLLFKSESSIAYLESQKRLVIGFNDQSGDSAIDSSGRRYDLPVFNDAGLAYSNDFGLTWIRNGQLPLPACGQTQVCVQSLTSDPWLASNGSRVLYAYMAHVDDGNFTHRLISNSIAVASSADGINFSAPIGTIPASAEFNADKPSISYVGATAVVVFAARIPSIDESIVGLQASDDDGVTWSSPVSLGVPLGPGDKIGIDNIVRLTGPNDGYLAYIEVTRASFGDEQSAIYHVVRLHRETSIFVVGNELFRTNLVNFRVKYPADNGHKWRDIFPMSMSIGAIDFSRHGGHIYLTYKAKPSADASDVAYLADCDDAPVGSCDSIDGVRSPKWRVQYIPRPGEQAQPVVSADPFGQALALAWYEVDRTGMVTVRGSSSANGAPGLGASISLRPSSASGWRPCATANGYYGDYMGQIIIPRTPAERLPYVVTAFSDTTAGCVLSDDITSDQHVQATVWP